MKKTNLFIVILIASVAILATSCSSELNSFYDFAAKKKSVVIQAQNDNISSQSTRSAYNDVGVFTWGSDEKLAVYSSDNTFSMFVMISGAGTKTATFSGTVDADVTSTYALYPYSSDYTLSTSNGKSTIYYVLPDAYNDYVPGQSNLPMYSNIPDVSNGIAHFYMTTGALRYTMKNLPAGTATLTFVTDKAITGSAAVNIDDEKKPYLKAPNGKQYVTYNLRDTLSETTDLTIDVPLPAGDYKAFAVDIKDKSGSILKSVNFLKDLKMEVGHIQQISFDYASSYNAYIIPDTGLPSVIIVTPDKADITSKEVWTEGALYAIHKADGTIDAFGTMSMKGRGNTTWGYPKKPYALKLDSKSKVLGMAKHKRWCLLANWMDRTMIRNAVAFEIARKCPGLEWTPSGEFVELVMNGTHQGNYYLCEQIKVDKNRVNITELDNTVTEGDGVTGGFIMELDTYYDEVNKFKSEKKNLPWQFKDPDDINSAQFSYMQNYVNRMEDALYDENKFAAREFTDFMDLESFADWWFVNELTTNYEPNHPKSSFMYKDVDSKNGKIKAGPVWDYDWATFAPYATSYFIIKSAIYYDALFNDETFRALVKSKWENQKPKFEEVYTFIDNLKSELSASDIINHAKWPINQTFNQDESLSFDEAIARLKNAYKAKLEWMNTQISAW